jgi:hypothetical protein
MPQLNSYPFGCFLVRARSRPRRPDWIFSARPVRDFVGGFAFPPTQSAILPPVANRCLRAWNVGR